VSFLGTTQENEIILWNTVYNFTQFMYTNSRSNLSEISIGPISYFRQCIALSTQDTKPTFRLRQTWLAVVINCIAYRSDVSLPIRVNTVSASSDISTSSSSHLPHEYNIQMLDSNNADNSSSPNHYTVPGQNHTSPRVTVSTSTCRSRPVQ